MTSKDHQKLKKDWYRDCSPLGGCYSRGAIIIGFYLKGYVDLYFIIFPICYETPYVI